MAAELVRRIGLLDWLRVWLRLCRKARQYLPRVEELRRLSPPSPARVEAGRVLFTRADRLGDWVNSLSLLQRLQAAGCDVRVRAEAADLRNLLADLGFKAVQDPAELNGWKPQLVLLGETARHLRSPRHPERWKHLQAILRCAGEATTVAPVIWRAEAWSAFPGSYAPWGKRITAKTPADSMAQWLQLPPCKSFPLSHLRRARTRNVVFNLSAGRPGESEGRCAGISFWIDLAERIGPTDVLAMAQPGDEPRLDAYLAACRERGFAGATAPVREHLGQVAAWLGRQGLLISSETGLAHLARGIGVPTVVLAPNRLVPFWYQPDRRTQVIVYHKSVSEVGADLVRHAVDELRGERIT